MKKIRNANVLGNWFCFAGPVGEGRGSRKSPESYSGASPPLAGINIIQTIGRGAKKFVAGAVGAVYIAGQVLTLTGCNEDHSHSYSDWMDRTFPTCTTAGEQFRTCSCGNEETRFINTNSLNHNFSNWIEKTSAACFEAGEEERTCYYCGQKESKTIAPLGGHNFHNDICTVCSFVEPLTNVWLAPIVITGNNPWNSARAVWHVENSIKSLSDQSKEMGGRFATWEAELLADGGTPEQIAFARAVQASQTGIQTRYRRDNIDGVRNHVYNEINNLIDQVKNFQEDQVLFKYMTAAFTAAVTLSQRRYYPNNTPPPPIPATG